jgi:hypothetical protein
MIHGLITVSYMYVNPLRQVLGRRYLCIPTRKPIDTLQQSPIQMLGTLHSSVHLCIVKSKTPYPTLKSESPNQIQSCLKPDPNL